MKTQFVVCLHGDEKSPFKVIDKNFRNNLDFIVAHEKAFNKNIRFIETDLNRSFPGNENGSIEEKLSQKLLSKLKQYDRVIDLHTATCDTVPFAIITKITKKHLQLVKDLGIKNVVYMKKSIASGKSLIDHVPVGISIECGKENQKLTKKRIKKIIDNYLYKKKFKQKISYFIVFNILKQRSGERLIDSAQSFKKIKIGDPISKIDNQVMFATSSFYPVLPREKNYKDTLCLMAYKISEQKLINDTIIKEKEILRLGFKL